MSPPRPLFPPTWVRLRPLPILRFIAAFVAVVAALTAPVGAQDVSSEYRLKAAFLYKFPQFVEWPADAVGGRTTLDLCVANPSPFGALLDDLVEGESIEGRPLAVRHVAPDDAGGCGLLYLPAALRSRGPVLQRLATAPVLTVSDAADFLDEGGMVQLRLVDNRIRFEISMTAAERAGLRISPQLLRLALRVRGAR